MKNIIILLSLLALITTSCSSSSPGREIILPDPGEIKTSLSDETLMGDWELYALNKRAKFRQNGREQDITLRYPETDGIKIHFLPDNKYCETNIIGKVTLEGTYEIVDATKVRFYYKKDDKEYTSERIIPAITNFRFTHQEVYTFNGFVTGIFDNIFRNTKNAKENFHPGIDKKDLSYAQIKGKWELVSSIFIEDGHVTNNKELIGEWFEFDNDKFKAYDDSSRLATTGDIIIVDDVIHLVNPKQAGASNSFTKGNNLLRDDPALGKETNAYLLWIKNWGQKDDQYGKREGFQVYDKYMDFDGSGRKVIFYENITEFRRKN